MWGVGSSRKTGELERATEIGICGTTLENSQDPYNWVVEIVMEDKARRWNHRRQRFGCQDQGFTLSLVGNGELWKAFTWRIRVIRVIPYKEG